MPAPIDLTGQEFKGWKVIEKLPSKNKKTYWLCECIYCKKQKEIQTTHLRNNSCGTCDCQKSQDNNFDGIEKKCILCGQTFKTIKYGGKRVYCFDCNPQDTSNSITIIRHRAREIGLQRLGRKCFKCGIDKPYLLDFHHRNPEEKDSELSDLAKGYDFTKFFEELAKCDLLCANCHRDFHWQHNQTGINYNDWLNN